jgi:alkanesulfonate monooxygenase SsuD/methylene tetrahydromethanopterin reductase-like flavin-dependent oxidoreductase (luciferase family)
MKYGIHLPHAGEQATPALIRRHAERAEDLGIEDVWVSEHIIVPRDKFLRVLTKDSCEGFGVYGVVGRVLQVVQQA